MTISYSKSINISDLFVYYIYIGQSSLTFLQTKSGKIKNKLKTILKKKNIVIISKTKNLTILHTNRLSNPSSAEIARYSLNLL